MRVATAVFACRICADIVLRRFGDVRVVARDHLRIDIEDVDRLRVIHHIGIMSAGRPHIHFHDRVVAGFSYALVILRDVDELKMNKSPVCTEYFGSLPAKIAQLGGHISDCIEMDALVILHRIDHRRIGAHGLKERLTVSVKDRVVGADIAAQKLLHDIGGLRKVTVKGQKLVFLIDLYRTVCSDADIRFDDHGITDQLHEGLRGFQIRNNVLARGRDPGLDKETLHEGFPDKGTDPVLSCADSYVKVRAQLCVQRKPVFIQRFQPVDPAVLVNEKSDRAVYLVIVFKRTHEIVFRQGIFQSVVQCVVGYVPDSQYIHAVPVQAVAELCAGHGVSR